MTTSIPTTPQLPTLSPAELAELHTLEIKAIQAAAASQMANGRVYYHLDSRDEMWDDVHSKALRGAQQMLHSLSHLEAQELGRKTFRPESTPWPVAMASAYVEDEVAVLIAEMLRPGGIRLCKLTNKATPPKVVVYGFTAEEPPLDLWRATDGTDMEIVRFYD